MTTDLTRAQEPVASRRLRNATRLNFPGNSSPGMSCHQRTPRQPEVMMSSAGEHHARAEELLEQARTTPDQISRLEILAEAQVHATLALSAQAGEGPPGQGQDRVAGTPG